MRDEQDMLTNVREYLEFRCGETGLRRRILSFYGRSWRDSGGQISMRA